MKLSISNIAWQNEDNEKIYALMQKYNFTGLEIAPTKIISEKPYENIEKARKWAEKLKEKYNFKIPSMQSIWYGRTEKIFSTKEERQILIDYTKKAIDFASAISCKNLVFGCPKNRNIEKDSDYDISIEFFKELGDYAYTKNTCIGMEANPAIYNTNFINDTLSAIDLVKHVNSKGFLLNLDIGTVIENNESIDELAGNVQLINHVHISEPYLALIEKRAMHKNLISILLAENYDKYISVEMKQQENILNIENILNYVYLISNQKHNM